MPSCVTRSLFLSVCSRWLKWWRRCTRLRPQATTACRFKLVTGLRLCSVMPRDGQRASLWTSQVQDGSRPATSRLSRFVLKDQCDDAHAFFFFFVVVTDYPHTRAHAHSLAHTITQSLLRSFTPSLTHSLLHSFTHSLTPSLLHSLIHSLTHSCLGLCCCPVCLIRHQRTSRNQLVR